MNRFGNKHTFWLKMGFSTLLLCVCMVLIVGVAWGRYRTEISGNIEYYPKQLPKIYLWGEANETGGFEPLPNTWALTEIESAVDFTITNGIPGAEGQKDFFASEDLRFHIRVLATEGIRDGENISIRMELEDDHGPTFYTGRPVRIEEKSPLYDSFGGGWIYYFYETDSKEAQWRLEGGELSAFTATIVCAVMRSGSDEEIEMDPSMLQLQVIAMENE